MLLENLAPLPTKTVNYAWKNSCEICISSYSSINRSVLQEHALFEHFAELWLIDQKLLIKMRTKQTFHQTPPHPYKICSVNNSCLQLSLIAFSTLSFTHQNMPDVLIGSLKAAKADADPQKTLTAPHVAGSNSSFPQLQGFAAVHQHFHRFFNTSLQYVFQRVIILVLGEGGAKTTYTVDTFLLLLYSWSTACGPGVHISVFTMASNVVHPIRF